MTTPSFDDLTLQSAAIHRIAQALCRSGDDADDLGQELWIVAHQREGGAPTTWLPWLSGAGRRIQWARRGVAKTAQAARPTRTEANGVKRGWVPAYRASAMATTDASGLAWFSDVWADSNLILVVDANGYSSSMKYEHDGRVLTVNDDGTGQRISVAPDKERHVTLRFDAIDSLKCLVLDPGGKPVPRAHVSLNSENFDFRQIGGVAWNGKTNDEGRCEIRVMRPQAAGALQSSGLLTASDAMQPWKPRRRAGSRC